MAKKVIETSVNIFQSDENGGIYIVEFYDQNSIVSKDGTLLPSQIFEFDSKVKSLEITFFNGKPTFFDFSDK